MNKRNRVEQLKEQEDIKAALQQTSSALPPPVPAMEKQDKFWFGVYILILLVLLALYYFLGSNFFPANIADVPSLQRWLIGAMLTVVLIAIAKSIRVYWINQIHNKPARYNFIGWIYLLVRQPYRVGDRIQIGTATGDVIDVSYLDTTLWEFGGPYLSTQHPSGRVIKFPNSMVLNQTVYNYSWPLFPYIWNEIKFEVAYDSDLEFISKIMQQVVEEDLGEQMVDLVQVYRELLKQTPVDELEIQERPVVHFRTSENTWLEVIVRYLVHPKESGRVKTRLTKKLLEKLNSEPERVLFPKSNLR